MKGMSMIFTAVSVLLTTATCAFASTTAKVYSSGYMVLAFLGFCALVVVVQLIPAIMTLIGMLKGMMKKEETMREVKVEAGE
ncbi:MAG TPA: hypothetical protein VL949_06965 [Geobacteraceae bacterium]|jgi:hypothetical protein|nr:hypothetical protein [Geobacteraceae bacterium]